jgi:hypothetical protein
MIRMKLFGYFEFNLLRQALMGRLAALGGAIRQMGKAESKKPFAAEEPSLLAAWDGLVEEVRQCGIRRVELRLASGPIEGRRSWIDPAADSVPACRWSISVSVQQRDGRACELRADGLEKPRSEREIERLTGMLRAFGSQVFDFVEDTEVLPLMDEIRLISRKPAAPQRKAA